MNQSQGKSAECQAKSILQSKGFEVLHQNYACSSGEIDLICLDGSTLVFVEVRYRGKGAWVSAIESIGSLKQMRVQRCAAHWLCHQALEWRHRMNGEIRFDVLACDGGEWCHWIDAW